MDEKENSIFLLGYKIDTIESLGKMVQARTHKKKRINKKWKKRFGFKSVPNGDKIVVYEDMMTIFMHPGTWEKIKKQLDKEGITHNERT